MLFNRNRVEGFISSPINYSTYYNHILKIEVDPFCNKSMVSLFVRFASDYFYACNFSQDPGDYRYPGRESAWSTIVRSFLESPISIQFIRDATDMLSAASIAPSDVGGEMHTHTLPVQGTASNKGANPASTLFSSQDIEKKSKTIAEPSFAVPKSGFNPASQFANNDPEWLQFPGPTQEQSKPRIRYGLTKKHIKSNKQEGTEKKKWKVRLCEGENCHKQPSFNWPGQKLRRFCAEHRSPGMVDIGSMKCIHEGCTRQPHFNFQGQIRRFCSAHKVEGMVNVSPQLCCEHPGCKLRPSFNYAGIKRPRFCASHQLEGMIARCGKMSGKVLCRAEGCNKRPLFNFKGTNIPRYCTDHKQDGMIVPYRPRTQRCEHENCSKSSSYNFPGQKRTRFCATHKEEGMIYVTNRTCEAENCNTKPRFNFKDERKGRFCSQHKLDGMIDVTVGVRGFCCHEDCERPAFYKFSGEGSQVYCQIHRQNGMVSMKTCRQKGCSEQPLFNFESKKTPIYCAEHQREGMIQISWSKKTCRHPECKENPEYNFINLKLPKFCQEHKLEGMVVVDISTFACVVPGCKLTATHANNEDAENPKRCARHKLEGMVRVGVCCRHPGCQKFPVFNVEGERFGKFCISHKEPDMVRVVGAATKHCAQDGCSALRTPFIFVDDPKRKFCSAHFQDGMIREKQRFCQHAQCEKYPSYDFKGNKGKGQFCSDHKLEGMVNVNGKKMCAEPDCSKRAVFNFEGQKEGELYCAEHKLRGMINVTGPKCADEGCWRLALYNFEGESTKKFCILHRAKNMVPMLKWPLKLKCEYEDCSAPVVPISQSAGLGGLCSGHQQGILLI